MYLVLTAMLALNVSAEIINAFFALNKGIKASSEIVDKSNVSIKGAIDKQADAYKNAANDEYRALSAKAQSISKEFDSYINGMLNDLVTAAGGTNPNYTDGRPMRYKDKDVTTNMFINQKKGEELMQKIENTRKSFLELIKDQKERAEVEKQIALKVDEISKDSKAANWPEYKFKQMPVAAVMPILTKFSADAKTSETAILNYFMDKVGGKDIKFDNFRVAIAPRKAYLIRGDKFEADIYLAAFSSNPGTGVSISANGSGLGLKEGVAHYETVPSGLGKQTVNATATIKNPLTGEVKSYSGTFEYEVGEKSATISAEKMNVIYMGVENPIAISAAGISSNSLRLSGNGIDVRKVNDNNYIATATRPNNDASITLTGENGFTFTKKFRVKPFPDPIAELAIGGNYKKGGAVPSGIMQNMPGLIPTLYNFDFDAKCSIQSYVLVHIPRRDDARQAVVSGPINSEAQRLLGQAKPGDTYNFMQVKGRCPGDGAARDLNSLSVMVR
jgi:gliding motility-associated protein GldM